MKCNSKLPRYWIKSTTIPLRDKKFVAAVEQSIKRPTPVLACYRHKCTELYLGDVKMRLSNPVRLPSRTQVAYLCNNCLYGSLDAAAHFSHLKKCSIPSFPIIYNDPNDKLKVLKIDGFVYPRYCRQLCLIGKSFIKHKTLYLEVQFYTFYVLLYDGLIAGFFSKENNNAAYNLSCIVILPEYRKLGLGMFLIDLSYNLGQGTPEKPLSIDGQMAYKKYWKTAVACCCYEYKAISIHEISEKTNLSVEDVVYGLELCKIDLTSDVLNFEGIEVTKIRNVKAKYLNNKFTR